MKNARLIVNVLILVLIPIIMNRQNIKNYITDKGIPEKSSNALNSIKNTSTKTIKGAKNISSSVYSNTKQTIKTVNSNVGDKVEQLRSKEKVEVPKILKSQEQNNLDSKEVQDIKDIQNINVQHEKEIGSNMLNNIAKLNEKKVAASRKEAETLDPGKLHEKHKRALDSKAVDFMQEEEKDRKDNHEIETDKDSSKSLFEKHREKQEAHIQKIGRKTGI